MQAVGRRAIIMSAIIISHEQRITMAAISTCHHHTVGCHPLVLQPNKDTINAKTYTHTVTYIDKPLQKYDFNGIKHDVT